MPKNFRDDPFADPPPITEADIKDGMFSLLNRGIIPKDVDLTPAFERGKAPFEYGQAKIEIKELEKINRELINGNQNQGYLMRGSNLNRRI